MAQDPNREFDKTSLRENGHALGVHRDYLAHAFRWGFISNRLVNRETRILDIGCGVDTPLVKVLSKNMSLIPKSYLGVDLNKLPKPFNVKWATYMEKFSFPDEWQMLQEAQSQFDLITCLEVVEHMRPESCDKLFRGALELLAPGGKFIVSTPVFNGHAAKNHINEMTVETLQSMLERAGWHVEQRYGTFASYHDIKKVATKEEMAVLEKLRDYYVGEVTACFLAPLYPDASRNNLWILTPEEDPTVIVNEEDFL